MQCTRRYSIVLDCSRVGYRQSRRPWVVAVVFCSRCVLHHRPPKKSTGQGRVGGVVESTSLFMSSSESTWQSSDPAVLASLQGLADLLPAGIGRPEGFLNLRVRLLALLEAYSILLSKLIQQTCQAKRALSSPPSMPRQNGLFP